MYNLKTRATIWYIDYAAQGAGREARDWILWESQGQPPPTPDVLLARMAENVARIMAMKENP